MKMWNFENIQDMKNTEMNGQTQLVLFMKPAKTSQQMQD